MSDCRTRSEQGFQVLALSGEVDLSWSGDIRRRILDSLRAEGAVLVELSEVSYIDSSGIAALVEGYQTARTNDQRFGLVNVSQAVMSVLKLARLDEVFPIYSSVDAAAA